MGLVGSIIRSAQNVARRSLGISPLDDSWYQIIGGDTKSGVKVSKEGALKLAVVYACIRILSEAVSTLPLHLYRKSSSGRERLDKHPVMRLLNSPHPQVTNLRWREAVQHHLLTHGNGYSYVVRTARGGFDRMILLNPSRVSVKSDETDGYKYAYHSPKNGKIELETRNVLHLSGLGFDGRIGYSPIEMARQAIGLGLACEEFAGRFFGNGTHPGAVFEHPNKLSPEAHTRLKESLKKAHEGLGKSHKVLILEEGMTFKSPGIPLADAQFLEQRKFENSEIAAKIYLIPPHKVGELDKATFSNIEQQDLSFYKGTLISWLVRWAQDLGLFFLTPEERETHYFEHDTSALLRGDTASRFNAYKIGRDGGWLNADEIRAKENMPPLPDGTGQVYLVPLNMVPADQVAGRDSGGAGGQRSSLSLDGQVVGFLFHGLGGPPGRDSTFLLPPKGERVLPAVSIESRSVALKNRLRGRYEGLFLSAADKIVQREARAIERAVGKHLEQRSKDDFNLWIDEFYGKLPEHILREFRAVYASYGEAVFEAVSDGAEMPAEIEAFLAEYQDGFAARYVSTSKGQLRAILRDAEPALLVGLLLERVKEWSDTRAAKVAADEVVRVSGAVTREAFRSAGFKKLVWVRQGSKSCPYCTDLDGKVVGLDEAFRDVGDYQPDGATEPLKVSGPTFHPPLHQGCICDIRAE